MKDTRVYKSWEEVITEVNTEGNIWYEAMVNGDEVRVFTNNAGEYRISDEEITAEGWEEIIL